MKKQFLFLVIIGIAVPTWAQKDAKVQADQAYQHLSYLKAADLYQQLGESGLDLEAKMKLADSYRLNGDTESAEYWYAQAINEEANPEDMLHYAQMLQSNGKCEKALSWYDQYRTLKGDNHPFPRADVRDCSKLVFLPKQQVVVTNARQLNSGHLDYSPVPYKGGVVFTSTRGNGVVGIEDQWTKDNFSDLFFAQKIGNQSFNAVEVLAGSINGDFHDGTSTFNTIGTKVYFSRSSNDGKNSKKVVDLKIYSAELINKKWENIQELPFNHSEYSTCHPTLSGDGNTLYFASNRPGGFGGMDLYKSTRSGSDWSLPENLGERINTAGNELFPFIDKMDVLFFASNGLAGIGGLDIYQTKLENGAWTEAENMGEPINSAKDDFGFCKMNSEEEGYFSSNRMGGFGGDDIYYWSGIEVTENTAGNYITVIDETSGDKIQDATVTIVEGIYKNKVDIPTGRQVKNSEEQVIEYRVQPISFLTDSRGKVQPDVRQGKTYTILIEKPGYTTVRKVVNANELKRSAEWIVPINKRKGLAMSGAVIHQEYNRTVPNAEIQLFNFCTGEYERTTSDEEGNFAFFLECNCDYELVANKERFIEDKKKYSTLGIDCNTAKPINAIMYLNVDKPKSKPAPKPEAKPIPAPPVVNVKPSPLPPVISEPKPAYEVGQVITLENVYYDFNKSTIRGDASQALNNLAYILQQYPSMEIELYSHTDSRGDRIYNENLSQKRADAAVQYLISRGIQKSRLTSKGYGEWLLKNDCEDGVDCDEWQHQENRRTEIKITQLDANVEVKYRR